MPDLIIPYIPRPQAIPLHAGMNSRRRYCIVAHRRFGKTVLSINQLIAEILNCRLPMPRGVYIAPQLKQAHAVAWAYLVKYTSAIPNVKVNKAEYSVTFPPRSTEEFNRKEDGGQIRLYGADNPDAMRGIYIDRGICDEVGQMPRELWREVLRPALSDRQGHMGFIGTPKGVNLFSEIYYHALSNPDTWFVAHLPASKTGILPQAELDAARKDMTLAQYMQEYECDFSVAASNAIFSVAELQEAYQRDFPKHIRHTWPIVLGIDVAWKDGHDRTVWTFRQGKQVIAQYSINDSKTQIVVNKTVALAEKHMPDATFIDIGYNPGVYDNLTALGFKVIGVNFGGKPNDPTRYRNKRTEMYHLASEWIKNGGSLAGGDPQLIADLSIITLANPDADNGKLLTSKKDLRAKHDFSPDFADSFVLTFAQTIYKETQAYDMEREHRTLKTFTGRKHDYDPFAQVGGSW